MIHQTTVRPAENSHWRWYCTCGRKGVRYIYKEHAESLGHDHEKKWNKPMFVIKEISVLEGEQFAMPKDGTVISCDITPGTLVRRRFTLGILCPAKEASTDE